jgi:polysaccharide biosynthesis protein PslE
VQPECNQISARPKVALPNRRIHNQNAVKGRLFYNLRLALFWGTAVPLRHDESISLNYVAQVLLRHRRKICIWALLMVAFSLAVLKVTPRKYVSEAKLFVRMGRESVALDPTATTGQTLQVQETRENQINSAREMLTSRLLLENVVDSVGAELILADSLDEPSRNIFDSVSSGAGTILGWVFSSPPITAREQAVEKLSKSIAVKVAKNSSVIDFSCQSKQPQLAQKILQAFLDAYREQHRAANRTDGALTFFDSQAARIKEQLDVAATKLRDAKNQSGLVSLAARQESFQTELMDLETTALTAESGLAASMASVASLRTALNGLPNQVPTEQTGGFANAAADLINHDYFQLRMTLRELESRLGEDHPKLKDLREQVRQSEAILDSTAPDRTQLTVALHPSRQALELDLRREEALAESLSAKAKAAKAQLAALELRAHDLNEHEIEIAMLEREVSVTETSYRSYIEHLEQARISDALDAERISNVNVVQPPTLVERPVSPRLALILGNGLLLALVGGLGLAFGAEYLGHSPQTSKELASELNLAPLRTIPSTPRHEAAIN